MAKGMGKGSKGATKRIILGVNLLFVAAGVIVLVCGIVAATATQDFRANADLFRKTNINAACTTVLVCGAVTLAGTIIGFIGVAKANLVVLKGYIVLIGVTVAMQLAMGSFGTSRNPDTAISKYWFEDTDYGSYLDKQDYQNYLSCCGWHALRDSFGPGMPNCDTECYFFDNCPSCLAATKTWIHQKVDPGCIGAIICALVEMLAMTASCYVIMIMKKDKDDFFEDAFHY